MQQEEKKDYKLDNPEYDKNYYINNKEKVLTSAKIYRENNKDKINERYKEMYECACGSISRYRAKARHEKSIMHLKYIESLKDKQ